jgi:serine/threonine-protein kinase
MDIAFGRRSVVARIDAGGRRVAPESAAESEAGAAAGEFAPAEEKYTVVAPIGSGGMGEVMLVQDRDLRRDVAMKVLRQDFAGDAAMKRRFVAEAQATSQLEHPGIPPVHDIGLTPRGSVYFTMKVVRGETLAGVLKKLVLGAKDVRQVYTLHKLVSAMERICEACHFAHEKGVVHRDLKPENVMLGEFGEVHVMDWGIAKVTTSAGAEDTDHAPDVVHTLETESILLTQAGTVKGTIPYMSPEQARGDALDRRSDVWSLGAMLYEVLTLFPAFEGAGAQLIVRVRAGEFPDVATRNPRRPVPEALAAVCRRAMSKDPAARHATAREFGEELRAWLDGRAEKQRRHREAEELAAQGRAAMAAYVAARESIHAAEDLAAQTATRFQPWHSVEEKGELLDARAAVDATKKKAVLAFAETTRLLEGALLAEPENAGARGALADLWKGRLDDAERRADSADKDFALTMVGRYDDGRLAGYLSGDGSLELTSDPPGAQVTIARFEDRRGILYLGEARTLGTTPLAPVTLPMGSYLCVLRHPGRRDVRYPVHITRNRAWTGRVEIRTDREVGEEFVLVPGGPFVYGDGKDARTLELPDFVIAEKPVTFGDWAEFLAAVAKEQGLEDAAKLTPRIKGDHPYLVRGDDGTWRTGSTLVEGVAREKCVAAHGEDFEMRVPVMGVSWFDAVAWCEWKTRTTGRAWRLPTEEEREKSARGVDGRRFPWGDLEDATLSKSRDSRNWNAQPEPVGSFPAATSVYGMVDATGGMWEWTDSWFDARAVGRVLRGGCWYAPTGNLHCANRFSHDPGYRYTGMGFRPARSV